MSQRYDLSVKSSGDFEFKPTDDSVDKSQQKGRCGHIKSGSGFRSITLYNKDKTQHVVLNRGSLIDYLNTKLDRGDKLKKGHFFGLIGRSSDDKIIKAFTDIVAKQSPIEQRKEADRAEEYEVGLEDGTLSSIEIHPIDKNFTSEKTILEQQQAHEGAVKFMTTKLKSHGATFALTKSPSKLPELLSKDDIDGLKNGDLLALDPAVFKFEYTAGVKEDIKKDGKRDNDDVVVYGAASQFNGCEAPYKYTIKPGEATGVYKRDWTQGPQAQLAFGDEQVEIINAGGNLGFNSLCAVLDDTTKGEVAHGYFTPSKDNAEKVIGQLKEKGHLIQYPCVSAKPTGGKKEVHMILVAAPAFGDYADRNAAEGEQRNEIEVLCALHSFRAQFEQCLQLATKEDGSKRAVHLKATVPGLGVFENTPKNVATAFYLAAVEYQGQLKDNNVDVTLQVFRRPEAEGNPDEKAQIFVDTLCLEERV